MVIGVVLHLRLHKGLLHALGWSLHKLLVLYHRLDTRKHTLKSAHWHRARPESDVTAETRVWSTGTVVPGPEHRAVCLKVRSETKTGQRSVPSWVGEVIDGLQGPNQQ